MWANPELKRLNGEESEEDWPKEKALVYELIDLLEDSKKHLASVDSCLQASYHVIHDLLYESNDSNEKLYLKGLLDELLLIAKQIRKEQPNIGDLEVKAFSYYAELETKKTRKRRKKKK